MMKLLTIYFLYRVDNINIAYPLLWGV